MRASGMVITWALARSTARTDPAARSSGASSRSVGWPSADDVDRPVPASASRVASRSRSSVSSVIEPSTGSADGIGPVRRPAAPRRSRRPAVRAASGPRTVAGSPARAGRSGDDRAAGVLDGRGLAELAQQADQLGLLDGGDQHARCDLPESERGGGRVVQQQPQPGPRRPTRRYDPAGPTRMLPCRRATSSTRYCSGCGTPVEECSASQR